MANTGVLKVDPLFVGLTRPTMVLGVNIKFVMLNGLISLLYFINTSDFKIFLLAPFLHGICYLICFDDPLHIDLFMIKMQKVNRCKNRMYYGANSYDPY
jgi:type IV secretion system protein VirB3